MATGFSRVNERTRVLLSRAEERFHKIYDKQCRRVYSLALWMTGSKIAAQQLASRTFLRTFAFDGCAGTEQIDQAFLAEVRELTPLEAPSLELAVERATKRIHGTMKRVDLERAVPQLPSAERLIFLLHDVEGYDQRRISRLLHISKDQVLVGLHRARMRIRKLVARMQETKDKVSLPVCTSS